MTIDMNVLKNDEKAIYTLRSLYKKYGYSQFKMSKFEEYDLYVKNKSFLVSDNVITFNDTDGKLMALKPDVTLSIIKNTKDYEGVKKVYYNENVYRVSKGTNSFKEIMQAGLECIGNIEKSHVAEVVMLAAKSLASISKSFILNISHLGIVNDVFNLFDINEEDREDLIAAMSEKNIHRIEELCKIKGKSPEGIKKLALSYGECRKVIENIKEICGNYNENVKELEYVAEILENEGYKANINIDFSVVNDVNYYNGIVFKGYVEQIADSILSGGAYDNLLRKMGRSDKAIGFAVYLDNLSRLESLSAENEEKKSVEKQFLNIALPKGRLGEKVYNMFEKAGFECPSIKENNRKLIFENEEKGVRYFWVKPSDVSIYVERGAADIGVAGKDILLEYEPDVYELLDLDIGKCRMAVAAKKDFYDDTEKTLRVATKFTNIAKSYYASVGRDIDIIHLNGSIEIAPILNLSDVIVDIVETGTTLKENDLEVKETIVPISARLIANKSSFGFKKEMIEKLTKSIADSEENND